MPRKRSDPNDYTPKGNLPAILRRAGLLGHKFIVVECSDHWSAFGSGYRIAAQCTDIASARRNLPAGGAIYYRDSCGRWHHVYNPTTTEDA